LRARERASAGRNEYPEKYFVLPNPYSLISFVQNKFAQRLVNHHSEKLNRFKGGFCFFSGPEVSALNSTYVRNRTAERDPSQQTWERAGAQPKIFD
jgi:hypothetical protein